MKMTALLLLLLSDILSPEAQTTKQDSVCLNKDFCFVGNRTDLRELGYCGNNSLLARFFFKRKALHPPMNFLEKGEKTEG